MPLKQATLALWPNCCIFPGPRLPPPIPSCGRPRDSPPRQRSRGHDGQRPRGYATVNRDGPVRPRRQQNTVGRPPKWPSSADPTPYEIFDVPKGAPYSKARFYELVKLYHPDLHHQSELDGTPHLTKLERYRLVVAANELLRDPAKRRQYDRLGFGWAGQGDLQSRSRDADRAWRQEPGNASMNATWEDWERWYQQRDGKAPEPRFMSNFGFVTIIFMLVLVGGWGQGMRAGAYSSQLVDMQQRKHDAINKGMRWRELETAGLTRDGRVESFIRQREGWGDSKHAGHISMSQDGLQSQHETERS